MYAIAATATGIGVAALTLLRRLERKEDDMIRRRIALSLDDAAPPLSTIVAGLSARGIVVGPAEYDKRVDERQVHVVFQARFPKHASDDVIAAIEAQPGIRRIRMDLLA